MPVSPRVTHWLRTNHAARMPRRIVTLDSEAYRSFDGVKEEQTFRLAVAAFDKLDDECLPTCDPEWFSTLSTEELWTKIAGWTHSKHRTVCWAHRMSYDLRLTQALEHLPALGFRVSQMAISDYGCWVVMRRGTNSLYLVDSLSHIPKALDAIAEAYGKRKTLLPSDDAGNEAWTLRCETDVSILRQSVLELLRLYRIHDLGDFRTTGAAQSSAAFRHRFLQPRSLLIHSDDDALAAERRACWAGRSEVWRGGEVKGPLYEYDFHAAYAHIAREHDVPARLIGEAFPSSVLHFNTLHERYAVLAECTVTTETPIVPTESNDRIVWPVGNFTSWLWDTEVKAALTEGATVEFHRAYIYHRAPILKDWATWIIRCLTGEELGSTPVGKIVAKEWSRSVIGRFGLRYPLLDFQGTLESSDLMLQPVYDLVQERSYMQLQVGNELYEQTERVESPNSCPQIMGYVMAACRVLLWEAMQAAGLPNVVSVDTDGLIVNEQGKENLLTLGGSLHSVPLRPKGVYRRGEFRGPRNIDLDLDRRITGVPRRAEKLSDGLYRGEVWESLPTALRRRQADRLQVFERTFTVGSSDPRRIHAENGLTLAHRMLAGLPCDDRSSTDSISVARV